MLVNAHEYASLDISTKKKADIKAISSKGFTINRFRLAVAIAKCTFTKSPDWKYGLSESIINILRVETLLHSYFGKSLLLNEDRIKLIRDFSKTTRVGELAQGVNFLFAQDELKIPTPHDFVGYFEKKFNKLPTGSTPDFIGTSSKGTYDLIESKGSVTSEDVVISRLKKALKQCDAGEQTLISEGEPKSKRKFGILALFDFYDPLKANHSSIHYCDPDNAPPKDFNSWELIIDYYTAIFKGFTGVESLRQLREYEAESMSYGKHKFKMFRLRPYDLDRDIFQLLLGFKHSMAFGLSEEILDLISSDKNREDEYFASIQSFVESRNSNPIDNNNSVYELFMDGTFFKID